MTKITGLLLGGTDGFFQRNWVIPGDFTLKTNRSFQKPSVKAIWSYVRSPQLKACETFSGAFLVPLVKNNRPSQELSIA